MLNGKNVLVTGGSRGIGAAIVERMAHHGANVAFTYLSSSTKAIELAEDLKSRYGVKVVAIQSNAALFSEAEVLVETVLKELGGIDILVNNAGITKDGLLLRMTEQDWDEVIQTNLKSVFNLTKQAIRPMMKQRDGAIINVGSVVGVFGNAGQANYAASKAGIIGFSKSIAKELGSRGIRCNVVAPGFIETEMTQGLSSQASNLLQDNIPLKRLGKAEEVAELCCYLSAPHSSYITGQVISICGGMNI
jgi:3-oxoacyl-[acyl-carrier protein] reductase